MERFIPLKVKLQFWSFDMAQNIVGPQIRKIRYQMGLTQEMLAARCTVRGLELSRATMSKIEAQLRCVTDKELLAISKALGTGVETLFPSRGGTKQGKAG
jgi:transcriptional regulator with XRE-family HTH domain